MRIESGPHCAIPVAWTFDRVEAALLVGNQIQLTNG